MRNPDIAFNPYFTNQVYRENETILGYEDLFIHIDLLSGSLNTFIDYSYSRKFPGADRLEDFLDKNFIGGYTQDREAFQGLLDKEIEFIPYGKLVYQDPYSPFVVRTRNAREIYSSHQS
jgi:hypothetical protein